MDVQKLSEPICKVGARSALTSSQRPLVSVVIVNYWHWDDTGRVVRRLRSDATLKRGDAEVVIVDNHSPAHPLLARLRRARGVSLRRWKCNKGFARAVNEGCRLSRGDWLLLLNPDTTVPRNFIKQALLRADDLVDQQPDAGIIGFGLQNSDGTAQLSTGRFPKLFGTLTRLLLPRHRRKYTTPPPERSRVDWLTGCCLMVRRDCWHDLGGFDPDFFLYYEDVDLCRRAREHGWSVWHDPAIRIIHHRPLHLRQVPAHLRLLTRHALLTYARKHWPAWHVSCLGGIVRLEATLRRLLAQLRGDAEEDETFKALSCMAADIVAGAPLKARARLLQVVRHQEERRASHLIRSAAGTVHCHSQPQSARSAGLVPGECSSACAAGC